MYFAFSSAVSIEPKNSDATQQDGPNIIPYGEGELDNKETHHQWYHPDISNPTDQSSNSNSNPTNQVNWSENTKKPSYKGSTTSSKSRDFKLVTDLEYCDRIVNSVAKVYEGSSADGLTHTINLEDGSKLQIHNINFQLIDQPNLLNYTKTPLDYRNEVGMGLGLEETQYLARPRTLSPL